MVRLNTITNEQYIVIQQFAKDSISTNISEYAKRNQSDISKITFDIQTGKIAECGVYNYIKNKGRECSPVDFKIYEKYEKSFDADLISGNNLVHVKSQHISQLKYYPLSWSFHYKDKLIINPNINEYVCLCLVDGLNVDIKYFESASSVLEKYTLPIKKNLRDFKRVLLFNDLI